MKLNEIKMGPDFDVTSFSTKDIISGLTPKQVNDVLKMSNIKGKDADDWKFKEFEDGSFAMYVSKKQQTVAISIDLHTGKLEASL